VRTEGGVLHERKVELFQDVILREMRVEVGCRAVDLEGFRFALRSTCS
jgi:hypothetical protein